MAYADSETVSLKNGVNTALALHAVPMNSYTGMDTDIVTEQQSLDDDSQSAVEEQSLELQNEPVQTEQMVLYGESATVDESDEECTDEGSTEEMTDGEIQMPMETEGSEEAESVITHMQIWQWRLLRKRSGTLYELDSREYRFRGKLYQRIDVRRAEE